MISVAIPSCHDSSWRTLGDFKTLVDAVHANGMKLVLDGVFNHMGKRSAAFKEAFNDTSSKKRDASGSRPSANRRGNAFHHISFITSTSSEQCCPRLVGHCCLMKCFSFEAGLAASPKRQFLLLSLVGFHDPRHRPYSCESQQTLTHCLLQN